MRDFTRKLDWAKEWGVSYDSAWKQEVFEPVLRGLDQEGKIGRLVVDVGAGAHPMSAVLSRHGRKIIEIDVAARNAREGRLRLPYDIGSIDDGSIQTARTLWRAAKYAEINMREGTRERVDTFICSDILNYVDASHVLTRLASYLKPGGRFVTFNMAGRGHESLFSERKFPSDAALKAFFVEGGFAIETEKQNPWNEQPFILVARKPKSSADGARL